MHVMNHEEGERQRGSVMGNDAFVANETTIKFVQSLDSSLPVLLTTGRSVLQHNDA